jgi:hypothetical protein
MNAHDDGIGGVSLTLDAAQLAKLARAVADGVAKRVALGRASFSVREVAQRNGVSVRLIYREITEGRLAAVLPGESRFMRITCDAERLWLHGQRAFFDEPRFATASAGSAGARQKASIRGRP